MDKTIEDLLKLLAYHKGKIVSTAELNIREINQARAGGRMYVQESTALGFVWLPEINEFPKSEKEIKQFEEWYPLDEPMPENMKDPSWIYGIKTKKD